MKITLTDRELMELGYDEPYARAFPDLVRSIVAKTRPRRAVELTGVEEFRLREDAKYLPGLGEAGAASVRASASIRRKLGFEA